MSFNSESSTSTSDSPSIATWLAPIALCIALVGIASASILVVLAEQEISSNAVACNRLGFAAIAFGLLNRTQRFYNTNVKDQDTDQINVPASYKPKDIGLLFLAGISFSSSLMIWAWSLTQTSVANSTLLNNMMPIFITLGGWLFLGQQFSNRFLIGLGVAIAGTVAIGIEDLQATIGLWGDAAALSAAMLFAINLLVVERLRIKFSVSSIMMWQSLIGCLFSLTVVLITGSTLFASSWVGWGSVLGLALFAQVIGQGLLAYSLKHFSASLVAVSMLAIPVIAAFAAFLIFSEHLSLLNWLAFAVVLVGIYLSISATTAETLEVENKLL